MTDFIFSNLSIIKRDLFGDKIKNKLYYLDDLKMNRHKDEYGTSNLFEYLRELIENKYIYDSKNNVIRFIKKFNICCC